MDRGLFFFERFLTVGGRHPWNVLLAARVRGPVDPPMLRRALAALQARHPMLRVGIVQKNRRPHFETAIPAPPIPLRMQDRTRPDTWFETVCAELDHPFDATSGPLLRVVWLHGTPSSELVLIADHCICDGRSLLLLLHELLDHLNGPVPVRLPQTPIATLQDLFPDPHGRKPARRRGSALLFHAGTLRHGLQASAALGRLLVPTRPATPSYVLRWEIEAPLCAALQARCRQEQVTPYTALATAFLRAVRVVRRHSRNRLLCPVDVRTQIPGLDADTLFGFPESVALSTDPALDQAFWPQVRALRQLLTVRRARLDPKRTLLTGERLHALSDWFVSLQLHGRARNDLMFSHLGEVSGPDRPGDVALETVFTFLSSMPWRGATAIFSLRERDVMRFALVTRAEILSRPDAERIRDDANARIGAALAVPYRDARPN